MIGTLAGWMRGKKLLIVDEQVYVPGNLQRFIVVTVMVEGSVNH